MSQHPPGGRHSTSRASARRHGRGGVPAGGHELVDWIGRYLEEAERYPVLSRVKPGEVREALPPEAPASGEPWSAIRDDVERLIVPGLTHWNHPGFFAYFAISASGPGVLAEFLSAAFNAQGMLWRTSPAVTELEEVALGWLRRLLGLPDAFEGVIYDTASISTLHALAAARQAVPEHAHSSVDKAVMTLGLGQSGLRRIDADERFRLRPAALAAAIDEDRGNGVTPLAVVATVGTTAVTSVDPVPDIADICARERLWLHVDAAYAGVAAMVPGHEQTLAGCDRADSLVVNPHKWLFTPFDLSALFCRRMDRIEEAFALTPDYLQSREPGAVRNLMDTGVQLGRRFRALKLWMVLRYFGADGIRRRIAEHMRLARCFADWVDASDRFERLAPAPFSVVCFRANPAAPAGDLDDLNARLLDAVNATGEVFLSHTRLDGRFALRLAEHLDRLLPA
ncbi:Tryptophan decarboxylase 2 [Geodia barretti]|uniref:Tryptophan decarboxylase 2 n=1 Tax=Geodia barretti TaxID=519541 RepID=A0AA35X2D4_GEOBA|nr:Tryptophan decarboxylase 2 [Geodia barretti]